MQKIKLITKKALRRLTILASIVSLIVISIATVKAVRATPTLTSGS